MSFVVMVFTIKLHSEGWDGMDAANVLVVPRCLASMVEVAASQGKVAIWKWSFQVPQKSDDACDGGA
jgi:hypothetical protein